MSKLVFTSVALIAALTASTVFAQSDADCLTANAERADREAYCFKQAQDAAIQQMKEKLDKDFQNGLKQNQTKGSSSQPNAAAPESAPSSAPEESTTSTSSTTTPSTSKQAPTTAIPTSPQNATTTETNATTQPDQNQTVNPGNTQTPTTTKPVLPKPKTHPPIQYY